MSKSYGQCSESQCTTTQKIQVLTQTFELILRVEISSTLWEIAVHRITEDPGPHPHFWIQAFPASINSEAWTSQSSVCVVSEEWGLRFEEDKMGKRMRREKSICCCNSPLAGFSWYSLFDSASFSLKSARISWNFEETLNFVNNLMKLHDNVK